MASVYKPKGRSVYRIKFKDQHGIEQTVSSKMADKRAAEGLAHLIETDVERIRAGLDPKTPLCTWEFLGLEEPAGANKPKEWKDAVADYLAELVRRGSKAKGIHYREAKRKLERIRRECGWITLLAVKSADFTRFLSNLSTQGRAPRTQNSYHETLRAFLNWCVEPQGWLPRNPIAGIRAVKVGAKGRRHLRRAYSDKELTAILATAPEPRRSIYLTAAYSGLRRGTLQQLERQDLTPLGPQPRWHVRGEILKGGRPLNVPMLPECAEAIRERWESLPEANSLLFGTHSERKRAKNRKRSIVPHTATLQADLLLANVARIDGRGRRADFHCFRYTFCRLMGERLPIQKVKTLMGHSTITLTADLYGQLGMEDVAEDVWTLPPLSHGRSGTADGTAGLAMEKDLRRESA